MSNEIINRLASVNIYCYGSEELVKFEKNMSRYFSRVFKRWSGNNNTPECYGFSSFEGDIANIGTRDTSLSHYDQDYLIYREFLDKEYMAYTTGYYGAVNESEIIEDISLESAQENKYGLLVERCDIQDGQTILDLGCGFGGLSKYLLKKFPNVKVVGINPSYVQIRHIRDVLIPDNEYFDDTRFTLVHGFFDDIKNDVLPNYYFDRVLSAGLLEHVTNMELLQKNISRILKPGGKCLHHCIVSAYTIPEYINSDNNAMSYYYPGAHIWPFSEPARHNLYLKFKQSWYINGLNYWKTLDDWHKRFWDSIEFIYSLNIPVSKIDDWNRYFCLCKSMFNPYNGIYYGNGHYLYEK